MSGDGVAVLGTGTMGAAPIDPATAAAGADVLIAMLTDGPAVEVVMAGAMLLRWYEAIAGGHGGDDVASVVTTPTADLGLVRG